MNNRIRHSGIITDIEGHLVHVSIQQSSACDSCKVAHHCNAAESKDKTIDISVHDVSEYVVGQRVSVSTSGRVGIMAVVWAYVLPLVLMLGVMIVTLVISDDEMLSAFMSLCSLVPYYILVYLLRSRIQQQVAFQIDSIE